MPGIVRYGDLAFTAHTCDKTAPVSSFIRTVFVNGKRMSHKNAQLQPHRILVCYPKIGCICEDHIATIKQGGSTVFGEGQVVTFIGAKAEKKGFVIQSSEDVFAEGAGSGRYGRPERNKLPFFRGTAVFQASFADFQRGERGGQMQGAGGAYNEGNFCFDPNTLIQMKDGSEKAIKDIQLGEDTKGGIVTGVFQFMASDEIHNYKGVVVAGSHYVKEDDRWIMVQDSIHSYKMDPIPVVYSLDTSERRIFVKDIEFADYNGDSIAKEFLENAGIEVDGFDNEVKRQVEDRLI